MDEDELILQFSSADDDWYDWWPQRMRCIPFHLLADRNYATGWIRRLSHSPFSHVDMMLPDGNMLGASNNPKSPVIEGNARGVAIRPQGYQRFKYRRRMVIKTDRANDIRAIVKTQIGKEFDNSGLKDFLSDSFPGARPWMLDTNWWCSELMTWGLDTGGFWQPKILQWPKNRCSPTDLLLLLLNDARWINRETFWKVVPGLELGPNER